MVDQLREIAADVIGTQEGLRDQLSDLTSRLGYERVGQGRLGGTSGEHVALLYDAQRIDLTDTGDRWLSDTPEVAGSIHPDARLPRMLTWARFRMSGWPYPVLVVNTHLSHVSATAREHGARAILDAIRALGTGAAVVVVGDFNTAPGSTPYRILTEGASLGDAVALAEERRGDQLATFTGFAAPRLDERIDWVLVNDRIRVHEWRAVRPPIGRPPPSDHLPIVVDIFPFASAGDG